MGVASLRAVTVDLFGSAVGISGGPRTAGPVNPHRLELVRFAPMGGFFATVAPRLRCWYAEVGNAFVKSLTRRRIVAGFLRDGAVFLRTSSDPLCR
jgi:hypothetical protein